MRLKTLEIKGFKSFADRTIIYFDERITGVVGPNGCGKSNIVDAIRWVIGEHKISNLRSDSLESLIFNGSKTRAASGVAEVSLTFENTRNILPTEFTTVTITRRFYKNGESEYRLNDVTCRLKDIQNLFLDTGVSSDSYAIIELGMVDDIIKDKDNSRRRMFEQAAGISVYKTRKKEAKQKLEATENDLSRIEDLLYEIQHNLKTLESQARKAERYQEVKKEYKRVSIELAKAVLESFHLNFQQLEQQLNDETQRKASLDATIATQEAGLEQDKNQLIDLEKDLQTTQKAVNDLQNQIRTKESEQQLARQRLNHLQEKAHQHTEFLSRADTQHQQLQETLATLASQLQTEQQQLQQMEASRQSLSDAYQAARQNWETHKSKLSALQQAQQELRRRQFELEKKMAVGDTSRQNTERLIRQYEQESQQRQTQLQQLQERKQNLAQSVEQIQLQLLQLKETHQNKKQQILSLQQALDQLREQMREKTRLHDARKNEYQLLKSLVDNLEGYPESIRFLKKQSGWSAHPLLLSDVLNVQDAYKTAIENLLEPYLNYYVVQDIAEARAAIELLDKHQKGRASFFILNQLPAVVRDSSQMPEPAWIPAMQVVETAEPYLPLISHLLGHVYLTTEIPEKPNGKLTDTHMVVLDKEGKIIYGNYFVTGGSVRTFSGYKIGRVHQLEKLQQVVQELENEIQQLQQQIQAHQQQITEITHQLHEREITQLQDQLNQQEKQLFSLQNQIEQFEHQHQQNAGRIQGLQQQLQEQQLHIQQLQQALQELNLEQTTFQQNFEEVQRLAHEAEKNYQSAQQQYNEHQILFTRQQSKLQSIQQEIQFQQQKLTELQKGIEQHTLQQTETETAITQTREQLQQIEQTLVDLIRERDAQMVVVQQKEKVYYDFRAALNEKEAQLRQLHRQREQCEQLLMQIRDQLSQVKLQLASLKERLQVEFKVNLEEIIDEPRQTELSVEELQAEADKFRKRLENMGEVNPTAIEAYQEMKKRYEFIETQKNDLLQAKNSLLATIEEVENTANERFLTTFEKIKENFQRVFRSLSSDEDQCDLILTDPQNLAESPIDIIAKPKGKKPASISQLSMGEKTLVAIALLFAIYLIKPAPFCIMDEVDAPLDDANILKFTNMIREFSEQSQFIIVTHNKQTMAAVDVIYGITMQEAGVSKLVPVDFRSLN
ncbi:chromosome segregation protein SMC [Thermoflavifilum thermophilum]|uniref:Chromosome partition protein Smc n=1 Tax=Thermoflavifilum thermophilum TaxID=1393122 RepID=A0A1I7NGI0_9BACT|nr:chromosome segregation protein SMC [Thermoflavifilum thermophilum]SFV33782.1 condensin subunit Smc [Thermoflavifilum thermophilum]